MNKIEKLVKFQQDAITKETGELFIGLPSRWYDKPGPKWRCINGHISTSLLKTKVIGAVCLACYGDVILTFPEDEEMVMDGK